MTDTRQADTHAITSAMLLAYESLVAHRSGDVSGIKTGFAESEVERLTAALNDKESDAYSHLAGLQMRMALGLAAFVVADITRPNGETVQ